MLNSFKIGTFRGIGLYVHSTFWLLLVIVMLSDLMNGYRLDEMVVDSLLVFCVFGCILLHELGHALAAKRYGIGTRDITLYAFGGVASLERIPEKPMREIAIALAGPAVNV